jgi:hypothetical protein
MEHHKPLDRPIPCHQKAVGNHMMGDRFGCHGSVGVGRQPRAVLALFGRQGHPTVGDSLHVIDRRRLDDDPLVGAHGSFFIGRLTSNKRVDHGGWMGEAANSAPIRTLSFM